MKILVITPIYHRPEKTKSFLSSLMSYDTDGLEVRTVVMVNGANKKLENDIKSWEKRYSNANGKKSITVVFPGDNLGKGASLNEAVNDYAKNFEWDYVINLDSDIVLIHNNWMKKLLATFFDYERSGISGKLGCVAPNMVISPFSINNHKWDLEGNQHLIGTAKCWFPLNNTGIAGPCFVISREMWDAVGGYYEGLKLGGQDGYMMSDSWKVGFRACVNLDTWIIHHKDDEEDQGYREWKMKFIPLSWNRPTSMPSGIGEFIPRE